MLNTLREMGYRALRWSERYTKTDMVEFATNNSWLFIGRIVAVASGMLLTIAFANLISPTAFGTYKYVIAMAGVIAALSVSSGLTGSATRAVARGYKNVVPRVFWISVLTNIPASLIALGIGGYYFYKGNEVLGMGMALIGLVTPFGNSFSLFKSVLTGVGDFRGLALYGIPGSLFTPLLIIGTLLFTENLIAIFAAYFLGTFTFGLFMYLAALNRIGVHHREKPDEVALKETLNFGLHLSVVGIVLSIMGQIDSLLLWHYVGPVELAIFAFAIAPVREIRALLEHFSPMLFAKFANRTRDELRESVPLRAKQLFLVATILAATYAIIAPFLYKILFPQYLSAIFWSQLLALTILVQPAKNVLDNAITSHGRTKAYYFVIGTSQTAKLILSLVLIPLYGLPGAVAGLILSDIATAIVYTTAFRIMNPRRT